MESPPANPEKTSNENSEISTIYTSESPMNEDELLYQDRPSWKDITPIKQYDGPDSPCLISYTAECIPFLFTL